MQHLFRLRSWIIIGSIVGCYQPTYTYDGQGSGGDPEENRGSGGMFSSPPTSTSSGNKPPPQQDVEEGFDPCPEDTYVLWEDEDGLSYEIRIEVFCEPVQDINLGCPAP